MQVMEDLWCLEKRAIKSLQKVPGGGGGGIGGVQPRRCGGAGMYLASGRYKGMRLLSSSIVTWGNAPGVIDRCLLSLGFCSGGFALVGH